MNRFIIMRVLLDNYETVGHCARGYGSAEEAAAEASVLSKKYPSATYVIFERRASYTITNVMTVGR